MEKDLRNEVKIAGFISEIRIVPTKECPDDYKDILMNVGQFEQDKEGVYPPKLIRNHVFLRLATNECDRFKEISHKTSEREYVSNLEYIEVTGSLAEGANGVPCILANKYTLLGQNKKEKNSISLSGKIIDIKTNNAYAGALIQTDIYDNNRKIGKLMIPVTIHNNVPEYLMFEQEKFKKGDTIEVTGSVRKETFTDGTMEKTRCSIAAENVTLKRTVKEKMERHLTPRL